LKTLIRGAYVLQLDNCSQILPRGDIVISNNLIEKVGQVDSSIEFDEIIDGSEMLAFPALFNAHTHVAMTLERGWAEDLPFDRWLNEKIWLAESNLQEEDVYWGTALAIAEMISSGTVGFADHYFFMDQAARAVDETGVKALLAWCHFGIGREHEVGRKTFEDTISFAQRWNGAAEGRIKTALGPHSPYMVPREVLCRFVEEGHRSGLGIHMHLSESMEQVEASLTQTGLTPVQYFDSLGGFDLNVPALMAHCNVVDDEDIRILAGKKVYVAHAPKTYQKLAMEMPPLIKMLDAGINMSLASDGPASNSDLNLLEVLRIAGLNQKFVSRDPEKMPVHSLLQMATKTSASAVGFENSGVLKEGSAADIVLSNTTSAHWIPRHNLAAGLVYSSHPADIEYVWCDGRLLYRKGEFLTLDLDHIRYEAEKRAFRMTGKPMLSMRKYKS